MKVVLRTAVAVTAALLLAQGAMAESCEDNDSCGGGGGPPSLPSLPSIAVSKNAIYDASPSDGWNSSFIQGTSYYNTHADQYYLSTFGGGVGVPFDDAVHGYGGGNSFVTLQNFFDPTPTIALVAHQDSYHGRANVGVTMGYIVTLSAPDAATADAIQTLMGSNPFATVQGSYTLSASGYGKSYANAYSSYGPNNDDSYGAGSVCDDTDNVGGCGTRGFDINLGFLRGDQFADGNANSFYAIMNISAEADAGLGNLGVWPGDAAAFIDPTVTLSGLLGAYAGRLTLDVGGFGPPPPPVTAGVPEPASWTLMLGGFGLVGGALRRRRSTKIAFAG